MSSPERGVTPWASLGAEVAPETPVDEMLSAAGLDWDILKLPLYYRFPSDATGTFYRPAKDCVLVRSTDGKELSRASHRGKVMQNREALEVFTRYAQMAGASVTTLGMIRDGKMLWALARDELSFQVAGEQYDGYLLFSNPHQYGWRREVRFLAMRLSCWDSIVLSRHPLVNDSASVEKLIERWREQTAAFGKRLALLDRPAGEDELKAYLTSLFPSGVRATLSKGAEASLRAAGADPTWLGAFMAVVHSIDHVVGHLADTRLDSAWFGKGSKDKWRAFTLAEQRAR